jgi:hypothetical protein
VCHWSWYQEGMLFVVIFYVFCVTQQMTIISLLSIDHSVFVMGTHCVFCLVRSELKYIIWTSLVFHIVTMYVSPLLQATKALKESRGIALVWCLDLGTRRGEGSASRPGRFLPPGKTRYSLYRMLGGPQGRSGQVRKISPPPGFDPRTVQPVASRYTD